MANTLKGAESAGIGTSETAVITAGATETLTVIGVQIANVTASQVTVTVKKGTVHLAKDVPIPAAASLLPLGNGGKVVLEPTESINVTSDTAASVDVVVSYLEQTP